MEMTMTLLRAAAAALLASFAVPASAQVILERLGTDVIGIYNQGAAEIAAYDPESRRVFLVNGAQNGINIISIANPAAPVKVGTITIAAPFNGGPNSVAVRNGVVAVALAAPNATDPGSVVFLDTSGRFLSGVRVGSLPDMVTFTPDGRKVLTANEGEPNAAYTIDPEGTVSVIDISGGVTNVTQANVATINFREFNNAVLDRSIRIFGPRATVAQDLEPEYIAVSPDSRRAWVVMQENNAIAEIDLINNVPLRLAGLGFKDHSLPGNGLDASDRDNAINIRNWPVLGMYQPDGMAAYTAANGGTYLVMANEGDAREYTGFAEEVRAATLTLDAAAFPNAATLVGAANLGRLTVTRATGDRNGDRVFREIYVFGARSFSIRDTQGNLVYDSGDQMERLLARHYPARFNVSHTNNTVDDRSDNKGPEPEGVSIGRIGNRSFAFIGLERDSGIMTYDITNPSDVGFSSYTNNRNIMANTNTAAAGDLGPEGLEFVPAAQSPNGRDMLIVANEISGTTTMWQVTSVEDYSGRLAVERGEGLLNRTANTVTYRVTMRNLGPAAVEGNLFLVLTGVPEGTLVRNLNGVAGPGPYVTVPNTSLAAGSTLTFDVVLTVLPAQGVPNIGTLIWGRQ
jgi:hypothetical protein